MRLAGWFVLSAVSFVGVVFAAENPTPERPDEASAAHQMAAACAKVTCRKTSHMLELRMPDGSLFRIGTRPYPYLDEQGNLIIFPGETVTLAIPKTDNGIGQPSLLKAVSADGSFDTSGQPSDSTLSFTLEQRGEKPGTTLTITNTVHALLKFDTLMFVPNGTDNAKGMRTSTCPLLPPQGNGKSFSGFEMWPNPVVMLVIRNIHVLSDGAPTACN